ncbi:MAG: hypothetical protein GX488_04520 [Clostridiales bacterium]|nr:hypothetical protein [Clostridiales bacterium]
MYKCFIVKLQLRGISTIVKNSDSGMNLIKKYKKPVLLHITEVISSESGFGIASGELHSQRLF